MVKWWLAAAMVPVLLATSCSLPTQGHHGTTTPPAQGAGGKPAPTLYAGTYHNLVYALSASGGQVLWQATDANWPLLANGVVYAASRLGLEALSPSDGTVRWQLQLFDQPNHAIAAAPVIDHGVLYVTTTGFNGVVDGTVYAVSAANGNVLWHFNTDQQNFHVSPIVADGIIYAGTDALYALWASDGHLLRRIETGGYVYTTPVIQAGVAYITINEAPPGRGSAVEAVRVADGVRLWRKHTGDGAPRDLQVVGESVYVSGFIQTNRAGTPGTNDGTESGYGLLYALHASDGSVQWTFRASGALNTAPTLDGNTLYEGAGDGYLNLLDRTSGTLLRRYRIDGGHYTTRRYLTEWTTPIVHTGVIYLAATPWDVTVPFHSDWRPGSIFALRERDGAILWEADLVGWISLLQLGVP